MVPLGEAGSSEQKKVEEVFKQEMWGIGQGAIHFGLPKMISFSQHFQCHLPFSHRNFHMTVNCTVCLNTRTALMMELLKAQ